MTKKSWLAVAIASFGVVGVTTASAAILAGGGEKPATVVAASPSAAVVEEAPCTVSRSDGSGREWISSPERQQAKDVFDKRIQDRFGAVDEKTSGQQRLQRGLIGIALDHEAQQIVVVTDPAADIDEAGFQSELRELNSAYRRNNPGSAELGVRVQEGCHSAAELGEAFTVLQDRDWHPRADEIAYGASLFASDSTYHVSLPVDAREVGDALKAKLGSVVTISYSETGPQGT